MSIAAKCDRCEVVFEWKRGCVTIEAIHVVTKPAPDGNKSSTWSGVDFCPKCSGDVLKAIGKALRGVPRQQK